MRRPRLPIAVAAVVLLALAAGAPGCHHAPTPVAPAPRALTEDEVLVGKRTDQFNAGAPLANALFEYDRSVLRTDATAALPQDTRWLTRWPTVQVTIEEHRDERGTREASR